MSRTAPARVGDETTLFAELHPKLARQVRRLVRTSEQNVQDACSFAFLQLLRYQPSRESVFPWLLTIAAAGLTARQARIVALHAAGHTYELISEMLGLSVRTVERQLLRARRKLRFALTEQGG
jgi:DNA-directed RNA polymerase specialized sigma24 family protein